MDILSRVEDSAQDIVGSIHIIVHSVTLVSGALHAIRGSTLLCKVDNCVGSLIDKQLHQLLIVFSNIQQDELDCLQ